MLKMFDNLLMAFGLGLKGLKMSWKIESKLVSGHVPQCVELK
jgi:hypothetical protein